MFFARRVSILSHWDLGSADVSLRSCSCLSVAQERNGRSISLKKTSICRAEFHKQPHAQRGAGYTPRVVAALRWLLGTFGDSPDDVPADFGDLFEQDRNRYFRDYSRVMSYFHEHGSKPGISTWVRDWTGDGTGSLNVKSRWICTFPLLLKMKGVECASWPWMYPVAELCDSALNELQDDDEDRHRLSVRHSFCLKVFSSVSAYAAEPMLAFFLFDVSRARSFYNHCIVAKRKQIDVACTVRNESMSEQYWLRERDLCADLVRQMHDRSCRLLPGHPVVYEHCKNSVDQELLAFPNVFVTLTFAEWSFPAPAWMRSHLSSMPEGSGVHTLHIYELVVGVLKQLLDGKDTPFWKSIVEHVLRVEFQGRGTLHFHLALWVVPKGPLEDFEHGKRREHRSDFGAYLEGLFEADVDVVTGSGFLNYINGYVSKSSDCVDFSSRE